MFLWSIVVEGKGLYRVTLYFNDKWYIGYAIYELRVVTAKNGFFILWSQHKSGIKRTFG
jgi:hypothetical protein